MFMRLLDIAKPLSAVTGNVQHATATEGRVESGKTDSMALSDTDGGVISPTANAVSAVAKGKYLSLTVRSTLHLSLQND